MLVPLSPNVNTPAWETHATISIDGSALYFVSDRKEGGQGGRDIWRCVKLPNGAWGVPYNLGPTINTPGDEDAPYLHPDGVTLFFSSTGHKNMGGFDVFKSVKNEDGQWSEPENLRAPINTPDDDIFYVQSADGKRGYISSNRKGNFGETDIYRVDYEKANSVPLTLLKGIITFNGKSNSPAHTRILVTDGQTGEVIQEIRPNEKTGKYVMILAPGAIGIVFPYPLATNDLIEIPFFTNAFTTDWDLAWDNLRLTSAFPLLSVCPETSMVNSGYSFISTTSLSISIADSLRRIDLLESKKILFNTILEPISTLSKIISFTITEYSATFGTFILTD